MRRGRQRRGRGPANDDGVALRAVRVNDREEHFVQSLRTVDVARPELGDTSTGRMTSIPMGKEPHGLTVWLQPGRYSLGHTGNMR